MTVYISTNAFIKTGFEQVFTLLDTFPNPKAVGIEIFPDWQNPDFVWVIEANLERLKQHPTTVHGPYFDVEHSAPLGSEDYMRSMEGVLLTAELAQEIGATDFVFHHNNKIITPENKTDTIIHATDNLHEITRLLRNHNMRLLIENAGVKSKQNSLFEQDEFIEMALSEENDVLIDIGHVHANGWDLETVIRSLSGKIVSYHLHNNDGYHDSHERIYEGTLDFAAFERLYKQYTPDAKLILEYGYHMADQLDDIAADIRHVAARFAKSVEA